jgi:hypothetical protein
MDSSNESAILAKSSVEVDDEARDTQGPYLFQVVDVWDSRKTFHADRGSGVIAKPGMELGGAGQVGELLNVPTQGMPPDWPTQTGEGSGRLTSLLERSPRLQ